MFDKISKIIIAEIVEALFFIFLIAVCEGVSKDLSNYLSCDTIYIFWVIIGITTPLIIFLELEDEIIKVLEKH